MYLHENARLPPFGRERLVKKMQSGQTQEAAARLRRPASCRCFQGRRENARHDVHV